MKIKKIFFMGMTVAALGLPVFGATNQSKQNILSDDSASKLQIKKIISGKQDAMKRVSSTFDYYTDSIYDIYVTPDFVTMIKLDPEENVQSIKGGNTGSFEIEQDYGGPDNATYILIQATDLDVTSNVNIITDKRIYMLNLFSTLDIYNPMVKFNYPTKGNTMSYQLNKSGIITGNGAISTGRDRNMVSSADKIDLNYTWEKGKNFSPTNVYNDGVKTVIKLPSAMQEAPVVMVKGVNSNQYEVVNFEYDRDEIVVHRVFKEAKLLIGKKSIIIKHN